MKPFADLLEALVCTPQRNGKLRLLADYFATTPDPDCRTGPSSLPAARLVRRAA